MRLELVGPEVTALIDLLGVIDEALATPSEENDYRLRLACERLRDALAYPKAGADDV